MTARPPRTPQPVLMPTPLDVGEPLSVGFAYYRTDHELAFYLRAFQHVSSRHMVVVLGLRDGTWPPADLPTNVRLILTAAGGTPPQGQGGWFVPDPFQAVLLAMTGRHPGDGLILLFPDDWSGESPEALAEKARRWRASPHSPEDDVFFDATHPN